MFRQEPWGQAGAVCFIMVVLGRGEGEQGFLTGFSLKFMGLPNFLNYVRSILFRA